jgi:predicted nucleic-acid-binding Zn-ribbon protein
MPQTSTCPKCDGQRFELRTIEPLRSNWKYNAVQCSKCGAVVGVVDYYNVGFLVRELAKKLKLPFPD